MAQSIIAEGKTTNEAIEKGLKELKVAKSMVDVRVIENEDKRSFFSILTPRVVKVELTVKENINNSQNFTKQQVQRREKREIKVTENDLNKAKENIEKFLELFMNKVSEKTEKNIEISGDSIEVSIEGKDVGVLIGYRGETLYAFQNILSSIANKDTENRVRVLLDIAGYKAKREKTLEELAEKIAKTVIRTKKSVTLEPMQAYERKIIHSKLQENEKVSTQSIGEEPRRRIVVSLNK
ncbi:MAG: KH domain-containing protein [Clostridia bacterium]|nr:KH domain-containing protein [Clostridia bacterium]